MPSPLGRVGNGKNVKGKNKPITDMIRLALNEECEVAGQKTKKMRALATQLVNMAVEGDLAAIREVLDRIEGKPKNLIESEFQGDFTLTVVSHVPERQIDGEVIEAEAIGDD